ncbi:hypothetical protein [Marinimicrobium sp. C2-29]|uniref:hypothetical protein n=1 Tax=Marinimicrobium sp. C2-29 TaxID=3139825 RepID=UPI003138F9E8
MVSWEDPSGLNQYEIHLACRKPGEYGVPSDMVLTGHEITQYIENPTRPSGGICHYRKEINYCAFPEDGIHPDCYCPNGTHSQEAPRQAHEVTGPDGSTVCTETQTCEDGQQVVGGGTAACDIPPDACEEGEFYDAQTAECYSGPGTGDDSSSSSSDSSSSDDNSSDGNDDGSSDEGDEDSDSSASSSSGSSSSAPGGECAEGQSWGEVNGEMGCYGPEDCPDGQSWGEVNGQPGCYGSDPGDGNGEGECDPDTDESCEEGDGSASGGDNCEQAPECEGDEIDCAQLQQIWLQRCGMSEGQINDLSNQLETAGEAELDAAFDQIKSDVEESVDDTTGQLEDAAGPLENALDGFVPQPAACESLSLEIMGHTQSVDCHLINTFKDAFGWFLSIMAGIYIWNLAMQPVDR